MKTTVGEGDIQMILQIAGEQYDVATAKQVAAWIGYTQEHVCRLCDTGRLLSHKVAGVWWIQTWQLEYFPEV